MAENRGEARLTAVGVGDAAKCLAEPAGIEQGELVEEVGDLEQVLPMVDVRRFHCRLQAAITATSVSSSAIVAREASSAISAPYIRR